MPKSKPFRNKREWKLLRTPDGLLFQAYNLGAMRALPEELSELAVQAAPVAHTTYRGLRASGITTYLLRNEMERLVRLAVDHRINLGVRDTRPFAPTIDDQFAISITSQAGLDTEALRNAMRVDITEHCGDKKAAEKYHGKQAPHSVVERIVNEPQFNVQENVLRTVKSGKGKFHDICLLELGVDFSLGCVANIKPDGFYDPAKRCTYCYAHQNGPSVLDTTFELTEESFEEALMVRAEELKMMERPWFIRQGQTTDVFLPAAVQAMKGAPDNLGIALEVISRLAEERSIACALPTKFPQYDPERAKQLIKSNTSLLVSIAYDNLEPGVIDHGFPTERRLEEALRFAEAGVNTTLYVATDITRPMSAMQPEAHTAVAFAKKHPELQLQYLDMRITRKEDAEAIAGMPWDELKVSGQESFLFEPGRWQLTGQNYLAAAVTHPDFLAIGNTGRARMCSTHVPAEEQRCGQCFMKAKR